MNTSPSAAGPTRLGVLLSESFAYGKAHAQTLVIGALISGVLLGLFQGALATQLPGMPNAANNGMGMDTERMEALSARMEAGDETAFAELEALLEGGLGGMDAGPARMDSGMVTAMMPALAGGGLLAMVVSVVAYAFFLLVAVEGKDIAGTFSRSLKVALPILGVMIWTFIRTFAWVPLVAMVFVVFSPGTWVLVPVLMLASLALSIFFYPRFIAAPLILLMENKGIMASVEDSYRRTRGYWGKIVGNMIVAGLIMWVVLMIVQIVAGIALSSIPMALAIVVSVAGQLYSAGLAVFSIRLSHTILQHPRS